MTWQAVEPGGEKGVFLFCVVHRFPGGNNPYGNSYRCTNEPGSLVPLPPALIIVKGWHLWWMRVEGRDSDGEHKKYYQSEGLFPCIRTKF